jgi:hypothetical protein
MDGWMVGWLCKWIHVQAKKRDRELRYVTITQVKNILMKGGACTLKLKRERYYTKCTNCSSEAPLLEDMGDLV